MKELCPECGAKVRPHAVYCENCGANVKLLKEQREREIEQQKIQIENEIRSKLEEEYKEKLRNLEQEYIEKIKAEKEKVQKKHPLFNEIQYKILIGALLLTIVVLVGFFAGKLLKII
jgi:hypothetical protein